MANALDVASFFIDMANSDPDDCMTNLRVNKLLYFSQGWSLARTGKPLFDEPIQAWKYGPVVPAVYSEYKRFGRERISDVSKDYSPDIFTSDELTLLFDVLKEYGRFSSPALVDLTHACDSPWTQVNEPDKSNDITIESMKSYFSALPPLETFTVNGNDAVGYRDPADGLLVLPKDYDDAE